MFVSKIPHFTYKLILAARRNVYNNDATGISDKYRTDKMLT